MLGNSLPLEEGALASDPLKAGPSVIESVEIFCHENGIPHFLMGAPDDVKMVKEAFMFVVSAALRQATDKERCGRCCCLLEHPAGSALTSILISAASALAIMQEVNNVLKPNNPDGRTGLCLL